MAKKKEKMLNISYNKANIIGMIDSFMVAIITSYFLASFLIHELGFGNGEITVLKLASFLIPILFIIFGLTILFFIVTCDFQSKK